MSANASLLTVFHIVKNDLKKTQLCSRSSYARKKVNTYSIVAEVKVENSPTDEVFVTIYIEFHNA